MDYSLETSKRPASITNGRGPVREFGRIGIPAPVVQIRIVGHLVPVEPVDRGTRVAAGRAGVHDGAGARSTPEDLENRGVALNVRMAVGRYVGLDKRVVGRDVRGCCVPCSGRDDQQAKRVTYPQAAWHQAPVRRHRRLRLGLKGQGQERGEGHEEHGRKAARREGAEARTPRPTRFGSL